MAEEHATSTYVIAEPFDRAVKLVRGALAGANLKLTGELNLSGRIQRQLLIDTAPCLLLFASPNTRVAASPAPMTPLHIVVSGRGSQTEIHLLRVLPRDDGPLDRTAIAALSQLQAAISHAIGNIAMRVGLGVPERVPEPVPEPVPVDAKPRPTWRKYLRVCGGFLVLVAGIVLSLPLVPGPGIPLILLGLFMLSDHFVWAKKTLEWAKQKWHNLRSKP